jgi:adenylate cyclase, class 2
MKDEIEVRLLDINVSLLEEKLKKQKAEFIGEWDQKRFVYDFNPVNPNKWIRLRTTGLENTLTIKSVDNLLINGTKELEIQVNDFDKTNLLLEELGYHKRSIQMNTRKRFVLDNVEIDIDHWPHLNPYVEFEGPNENKIKEVMKKLKLNYNETTTLNVQDIYFRNGYTKEDLNNLEFREDEIE